MEPLKIYFLGSGPIGIPIIEELRRNPAVNLLGIGTQPDRPAGRKRILTPTVVGAWAEANGIKTSKSASVNSEEFLAYLQGLNPDILLVVSFGQILKEAVLKLPSVACVNVHASLLPRYRGASPITKAIVNGDKKTGVAFMQMEKGLDTGPVYSVYERELNGTERADTLEHELGVIAAEHIVDDLLKIKAGILKPVKQDNEHATYAAKIVKNDGLINWSEPASAINARLRAYCHWPGAFFHLGFKCGNSLEIKITECRIMTEIRGRPGEVLEADKNAWVIACGEGAVELSRVVPQGKKEMAGPEFLRGLHNGADGMKVLCGN